MTRKELESNVIGINQQLGAISPILLTIIFQISISDNGLADRIKSNLKSMLPIHEGEGKELIEELVQALDQMEPTAKQMRSALELLQP